MYNVFFCIHLLVMPKYWGKQIFAHGSFPEVGQKQKTEEKKEEKKKERLNNDNNNGQAKHGAGKHAWRTQACMAHTSRLGQLVKVPGMSGI